ncbi:MAG: PEP-CTERM sorting domain-containing protein [Acidobacteriota bacterium]|nr:PEP-CTERM sorting domain-containing protein [Acidobacteriota bacterium]
MQPISATIFIPATGAAKLIGPTGIPAFSFNPNIPNPDGSLNIFDESLFDVGGKLYAYFDSGTLDLETSTTTPVVPAELYQIDPSTGHATPVARTVPNLSTIVNVNGTVYAFHANAIPNQVVTLNLANGNIGNPVSELYPDAGQLILGASPVPEPASVVLAGIGIAGILFSRRRRRFSALALSIVSMALYPTSNVLAQGPTFIWFFFYFSA